MEIPAKTVKLMKYGIWAILIIVLVSGGITLYDRLFSKDKIILKLEENNRKIERVIEANRKIEQELKNTREGINEVHKSLLESQLKLTELINDTKGAASTLKENTESVQDELNKAIEDIDKILHNDDQ